LRIPSWEDWLDSPAVDAASKEELRALTGAKEREDRFYRFLAFGTGGLRGKMGAGNNRMNLYTVRKATAGLASYLNGEGAHAVCIGYDTRNHSQAFAHAAAEVLAAAGIRVYLFRGVRPTPMLSWAVRFHQADAGIVLTASHNPKEYNGYKVYGPDGGQITDRAAACILKRMEEQELFQVPFLPLEQALQEGRVLWMGEETDAPYFEQVKGLVLRRELLAKKAGTLRILYSPLHGAGSLPVRRVLKELGFTQTAVVPEQEQPDGDFPTAPRPNPENREVFALAVERARDFRPDLIFATDPDCDRIGVLSQDENGDYVVLTGNQTGALLTDYLLHTRKELGMLPENAAVVKTIVTTPMANRICAAYGVTVFDVLTGFKYIGELAEGWQKTGEYRFLFGFEESYGYLSGDFVRDKDAVIASALIAEMALWYKEQGLTLYQALEKLFRQYGYFQEKLLSVERPGREGQEEIRQMLSALRAGYPELLKEKPPAAVEDYRQSVRTDCRTGERTPLGLPESDVLKFFFEDGGWLVLRPSGTEPKVKLYLSAVGTSREKAGQALAELERLAAGLLRQKGC
jgi:phosphoglucomutase